MAVAGIVADAHNRALWLACVRPQQSWLTAPPSSTASAANATPRSRARAPNRRTHPRAVVYGTPARSAAGRTPPGPPAHQQRQPAEHLDHEQVDQTDEHESRA